MSADTAKGKKLLDEKQVKDYKVSDKILKK